MFVNYELKKIYNIGPITIFLSKSVAYLSNINLVILWVLPYLKTLD
jgi:hypothetical protein